MATDNFQSDVGIKISQPFYDVKTAGDSQLIFNSSWPAMRIAREDTFVNSAYGGSTSFAAFSFTYSHNLGYTPFTMVYGTDYATGKIIANDTAGGIVSFGTLTTTSIKILCEPTLYDIHVVFYTLDITISVDYPFIKQPSSNSDYNPDYGIKYVKQGKLLDSTDMRDFIIHSRCQGPQLLTVKCSSKGDSEARYSSTVGYTTWVYAFYGFGGTSWRPGDLGGQALGAYFTDTNSSGGMDYWMGQAAGDRASLVVLRDPLFASTQVRVNY